MQKQEKQLLEEIFKNLDMGMQSINDLMPKIDNATLKTEVVKMYENYDKIAAQALVLVDEQNVDVKTSHPFKKAMLWSSIQLNTLKDNSTNHILEMLIQGCAMGYASLINACHEYGNSQSKVYQLAQELIKQEQEDERQLTKILSAKQ